MDIMSAAAQNFLSPFTLFFLLGILAGVLKSSLTIPETVSKSIALYLMIAIGYRGGADLSHNGLNGSIVAACLAAVALSAVLPFVAYVLLRWTTHIDSTTAAAVGAHYGSVSAVTFATTIAVLNHQGERFEPYIVTLMAVMEAPAILTGLILARRGKQTIQPSSSADSLAKTVVAEVLLHGSVFLLLGSFAIGWLTGSGGFEDLNYVFAKPFKGILCIFILELGLLVAQRLSDLKALSLSLVAFSVYMPLIGASAGLGVALILGLSVGGATLLAVLAASASYIVVPAVMRDALPKASPAIYMTLSLGITFPFNLIVGIPLYHSAARTLLPAVVSKTAIDDTLVLRVSDEDRFRRKAFETNDSHSVSCGTDSITLLIEPGSNRALASSAQRLRPDDMYYVVWPCEQKHLALKERMALDAPGRGVQDEGERQIPHG